MSIFVRLIDGTQLVVDISVDTTLEDVAEEIKSYIENPRLTYQGEVLTNHKETLADLGICPESTITAEDSYKLTIILGYGCESYDGKVYYIIDEKSNAIYSISIIEQIVYCDRQPIHKLDETTYRYHPYANSAFITTITFGDEIVVSDDITDVPPHISTFKKVNKIEVELDTEYMDREYEFIQDLMQEYPQLDITMILLD